MAITELLKGESDAGRIVLVDIAPDMRVPLPTDCQEAHARRTGLAQLRVERLLAEARHTTGTERVESLSRVVVACGVAAACVVAGRIEDRERLRTALACWELFTDSLAKVGLAPSARLGASVSLLTSVVESVLAMGCAPCAVFVDRMVRYIARVAFSCDGDLAADVRAQLRLVDVHVPSVHCVGERHHGPVQAALSVAGTNAVAKLFVIGDTIAGTHTRLAGAVWTRALSVAELQLRLSSETSVASDAVSVLHVSARNSFFARVASFGDSEIAATAYDAMGTGTSLLERRVLTLLCTSVALYAHARGEAVLTIAAVERDISLGLLPAFGALRNLHRDLALEAAYRMALALITALALPAPPKGGRVKLQGGGDIAYQVWKRATIALLIRVAAEVNAQLDLPLPPVALLPMGVKLPAPARPGPAAGAKWPLNAQGWVVAPRSASSKPITTLPPLSWIKVALAAQRTGGIQPADRSPAMWQGLHDVVFHRFCGTRMRDRIRCGSACVQARTRQQQG